VSNARPGKEKESNWLPAAGRESAAWSRASYGPSKAAMRGNGSCRRWSRSIEHLQPENALMDREVSLMSVSISLPDVLIVLIL